MCQINRDGARYVFVRDDDTGEVWNIGQGPVNTPMEEYRCTHAIAYSQLSSSYKGLRNSWRIFVPRRGFHEVRTLSFQDQGNKPKNLSVFSAVTFYLEGFSYPRYYEMYRCMSTSYDQALGGVFCDSAHPFAPHKRYKGYLPPARRLSPMTGTCKPFAAQTAPSPCRMPRRQLCSSGPPW